jgi:hypothetical protein
MGKKRTQILVEKTIFLFVSLCFNHSFFTTLRVRQSPISAEAKTGAGLTKTQRHQEKSISKTHTLTGFKTQRGAE